MNARTAAAIAALGFAIAGCVTAPQKPIELQSEATKGTRIGVAMTPLPAVDTDLPGAGCLLCIGAAILANNSLIDHSRTLPVEDLPQLAEEIAKRIRAKGGNAIVIKEPLQLDKLANFESAAPDAPKKNFGPLRERYGVDKLVVVELRTIGMLRTYSSYFPTSDPKATVQGRGYMVNLQNNTYEWYRPVAIVKASDKAWDEPPKFPGLTNAYFQVLEISKDQFLKPFE
jgi:hypothetical protein